MLGVCLHPVVWQNMLKLGMCMAVVWQDGQGLGMRLDCCGLAGYVPPSLCHPLAHDVRQGGGGVVTVSMRKEMHTGLLCCALPLLPAHCSLAGHFEALFPEWRWLAQPCFVLGEVGLNSGDFKGLKGGLKGGQWAAAPLSLK